MKNIKRNASLMFVIVIMFLMGANVFFFSKTITLSDKIVSLEEASIHLERENVSLEKKLYQVRSLNNLEVIAKKLEFTKPIETLYLEHRGLAQVQKHQ